MDSNQQACLSLLREGDRDRYLCALLTPETRRGPIAALYAFNLEIARIRDLVSEPMMGEIRMQWWKDLIGGQQQGDSAGHPVAAALVQTIEDHALPRQTLINMIEARQFDLYDDPMPDRNTFEGYAGETACALIQLATLILDAENSVTSAAVAGHAGVAQLTAGTLQLMPRHRTRGQLYVPAEILTAAGLDRGSFLECKNASAVAAVVEAFAAVGREHLKKAREGIDTIAPSCFAAFLPVAITDMVFDRAETAGPAVLDTPVHVAQWRRQIRFWNAARRHRI